MRHLRAFLWILATAFAALAGHGAAAERPTVADLAWMTGSWTGSLGDSGLTLEENWILPIDGSIASLVRVTGTGSTSMVELIVVEEEDDTLMLRVQQWDPGFAPRTPGPQTMALRELGGNGVSFEATGEAGFRTLTYSRPAPDTFVIEVEVAPGEVERIELRAR